MTRKKSLRDSTSLDPALKVNKSINFSRKHSNDPARKTSYKSGSTNKHLIVSELNRSIESIKIKKNSKDKHRNHFKIKNNKIELYWIQEEKEDKGANILDSLAASTQDPADSNTRNSDQSKKSSHKNDDLLRLNKMQLDAIITKKMKRTDGFKSFKHSIRGGNSSHSLFPSSSGETIVSK